jgi:hypothetical protein
MELGAYVGVLGTYGAELVVYGGGEVVGTWLGGPSSECQFEPTIDTESPGLIYPESLLEKIRGDCGYIFVGSYVGWGNCGLICDV